MKWLLLFAAVAYAQSSVTTCPPNGALSAKYCTCKKTTYEKQGYPRVVRNSKGGYSYYCARQTPRKQPKAYFRCTTAQHVPPQKSSNWRGANMYKTVQNSMRTIKLNKDFCSCAEGYYSVYTNLGQDAGYFCMQKMGRSKLKACAKDISAKNPSKRRCQCPTGMTHMWKRTKHGRNQMYCKKVLSCGSATKTKPSTKRCQCNRSAGQVLSYIRNKCNHWASAYYDCNTEERHQEQVPWCRREPKGRKRTQKNTSKCCKSRRCMMQSHGYYCRSRKPCGNANAKAPSSTYCTCSQGMRLTLARNPRGYYCKAQATCSWNKSSPSTTNCICPPGARKYSKRSYQRQQQRPSRGGRGRGSSGRGRGRGGRSSRGGRGRTSYRGGNNNGRRGLQSRYSRGNRRGGRGGRNRYNRPRRVVTSYCQLWSAPKRCPTYIVSKSKKSVVKGSTDYKCTCSKHYRTYYRRINRKFQKFCIKKQAPKKAPKTTFCTKLSEIACATSTLCRWKNGACAQAPAAPTPAAPTPAKGPSGN